MDEQEEEYEGKAEELMKIIKEGGYTLDDLKQVIVVMAQEEKMASEEAEPTQEDGEKVFGMKFKE